MRRLAAIALLLFAGACATQPTPQKFVVFFTEWSAQLDDAGQGAVAAAAKWAQAHPGAPVSVTGYADPEGSMQANVDVSRTRAQVVFDQLVRDGVPADRITRTARGPVDFTLSSLESRRVEIAVAGF
jgi:outer membrane protein OmpA-like peptidoglycan-associated protein